MNHFHLYINSVNDVSELERIREEIKEQVVDPQLNWQSRMLIYSQVQFVTERITMLRRSNHAV
ncbi:hypothetical protein [Brevibacillus sp. NRS-1366]|uniref:hypothetical protein n=1 Tax=Brevibacillus sp. NRS-1366 TaxID=3233899 RepID=UPI003D19AAFD